MDSATAAKPHTLAAAGFENFATREVHRSEILNAEYNPRKMTDSERDKLKVALRKHGLVAPITWNSRSGHIVGGHQRIAIMDSLMRTKDYSLTVASIDVDEAREKELNVLLNNQAAQGSFDLVGLKEMFADSSVSLEGAGFDMTDMINMFGEGVFNDGRDEDLAALADKLQDVTQHYTAVQRRNMKKAQSEYYLVFVFPDGDHVDKLIADAGWKNYRYQSGLDLMRRLGISPPVESTGDE